MWNADLLRCARASLQSTAWKTGTPSYSLTSMTLLTTEVGDKNQWNVRNNAALEVGVSKEIILESVFQQPGVKQTENSESSWHHCSIILRPIFNTPSHYSRLILLPISVYYLWLPLWVFPGNDNQVLILLQIIYKRCVLQLLLTKTIYHYISTSAISQSLHITKTWSSLQPWVHLVLANADPHLGSGIMGWLGEAREWWVSMHMMTEMNRTGLEKTAVSLKRLG